MKEKIKSKKLNLTKENDVKEFVKVQGVELDNKAGCVSDCVCDCTADYIINSNNDTIVIKLNKKQFEVDKNKLYYVASRFVNHDITNEEELHEVMKKYKLYDEYFLENFKYL